MESTASNQLKKLQVAIERARNGDISFFTSAYYWRFKKVGSVLGDVTLYRQTSTIPPYVIEYLNHIGGVP